MKIIPLEWSEFKTLHTLKVFPIQYTENDNAYEVWFTEGLTIYETILYKRSGDSDIADFEDNYKDEGNMSTTILNMTKTKVITGEAIITGTNQVIVEYTVPTGKIFYLTDIIVGGDDIDKKQCKLDSTVKLRIYHKANETIPCSLTSPIKINSGETFEVKNIIATSGTHIATLIGVLHNG